MKTSIYIENGVQQIILQPENKFEKNILQSIRDRENEVEFHFGSFSTCHGGYIRRYNQHETNEDSLMVFLKQKEVKP